MAFRSLCSAALIALASTSCTPYRITGTQILAGTSPESLLVRSHASFFNVTYMRRHSLENGAVLASASVWRHLNTEGVRWRCEAAMAGRLWCSDDKNGVRLLDAESLDVIAGEETILLGVPEAARRERIGWGTTVDLGAETRGYVFRGADGFKWIIDPRTLTPTRVDSTMTGIPDPDIRPSRERYPPPVDQHDGYSFALGTSAAYPHVVHTSATLLYPEYRYLEGKVVARLDNPPRVLFLEAAYDRLPILWCLSPDASVQWNVKNFTDDAVEFVSLVTRYRDMLVLATSKALFAVREKDGAVVWTSAP